MIDRMDQHSRQRHPALANIEIGAGEPVAYRGQALVHALKGQQAGIGSTGGRGRERCARKAQGGKEGKRLKHLNDLAA